MFLHLLQGYTVFLFTLLFLPSLHAQSSRHALLVGVGHYPVSSGWEQLAADNDVELIQHTLLNQNFAAANIATLTDQQATKSAILRAIRSQLALKVKPGGLAVFHFSGHGQQLCDNNGDESDGLDEALVRLTHAGLAPPAVADPTTAPRDHDPPHLLAPPQTVRRPIVGPAPPSVSPPPVSPQRSRCRRSSACGRAPWRRAWTPARRLASALEEVELRLELRRLLHLALERGRVGLGELAVQVVEQALVGYVVGLGHGRERSRGNGNACAAVSLGWAAFGDTGHRRFRQLVGR